jgi:hypothetical protein
MRLFDPLLRKIAAYVTDYSNRPGDPNEIARALKAYDRLCEDIKRGASADDIARNELFHQQANNRAARVT